MTSLFSRGAPAQAFPPHERIQPTAATGRGGSPRLIHEKDIKAVDEGRHGHMVVAFEDQLYVLHPAVAVTQVPDHPSTLLWLVHPRDDRLPALIPMTPFRGEQDLKPKPLEDARVATPSAMRGLARRLLDGRADAAGVLALAEGRGHKVELSPSRTRLIVTWRKGRVDNEINGYLEGTEPILVAHLRGEPLTCDAGKHRQPEPAVTILVPSVPACTAHAAKGKAA